RMKPIAQLFSDLKPDPWREKSPFAPEVQSANAELFATTDPHLSAKTLNAWIQKHQPCLFGKAAATLDLISYCILTESDLRGSEDSLMSKIQAARIAWTREAFHGRKSGFIVCVISPTIATALPSP